MQLRTVTSDYISDRGRGIRPKSLCQTAACSSSPLVSAAWPLSCL